MLENLSIKKALEILGKKEISALELTKKFLEKIADKNPELFAYLEVFEDSALKQAKSIDKKRLAKEALPKLAGIPVAIKDNILIEGKRASSGSKVLDGFVAPYNATVISGLKKQGVIFLGRANMDEFAMGSSTENSAFGPTKNPHNTALVPGGSSGGPAAALVADLCVFALGSDTGGSIRQPAAFCGAVGLKPTYGTVSRYGLMAMASSFDQIGPLAKSVEDAETVFGIISGRDRMDSTSVDYKYQPLKNFSLSKMRVGFVKEWLTGGLEKEIADRLSQLLKELSRRGAQVVEISLPHVKEALSCYYILMPSEVSSNLARYDGIKYGLSQRAKERLADIYFDTRQKGFGDEVRRRIMIGTYALSAGYYDAYYLTAQKVRNLIRQDFKKAFAKADVILSPATPGLPFKLGEKTEDPVQMYLEDAFTVPVNLAGLAALVLPVGQSKQKLPIGGQLIADYFQENKLFALGKEIERLSL